MDLEKTTLHMSVKQKKFMQLYAEAVAAVHKSAADSDDVSNRKIARCLAGAETIVKGISRKAVKNEHIANTIVVTLMRYFVCIEGAQ